ncbi:hypothetical protein [Pseudofrankia sp. BMG5.37]|uniref:hypothetical protein n=1 Tax=Pseudofrankia sp. BMG5.37 TaxID=3050035 RepID=UPI002894924E|nr:hypothetical protein [Pseudofrankia sp. BMG5.37]MDT3445155.1 hypothetical protein [Pseudofrankia sp. BMG5.37]
MPAITLDRAGGQPPLAGEVSLERGDQHIRRRGRPRRRPRGRRHPGAAQHLQQAHQARTGPPRPMPPGVPLERQELADALLVEVARLERAFLEPAAQPSDLP